MRMIMVNHVKAESRRLAVPEGWEIWLTSKPIGETYYEIATRAVKEEWDTDVVVIQDDIRGDFPVAEGFTVYGTVKPGEDEWHVCPKAFAATPPIWLWFAHAWRRLPVSVCPSFSVMARHAQILNSVVEVS